MVKELGPVLTALMVTGRVGSGIAAELGSMVVTDQIAALRALGTDPVRKLVIPRVLAGTIMVPVLTIISDGVGMVGGLVISVTQLKVAGSIYWSNVTEGLYMNDLWMGLIKPVVLGFALVTIGCHVGLRAPRAARRASGGPRPTPSWSRRWSVLAARLPADEAADRVAVLRTVHGCRR